MNHFKLSAPIKSNYYFLLIIYRNIATYSFLGVNTSSTKSIEARIDLSQFSPYLCSSTTSLSVSKIISPKTTELILHA